MLLTCAPHRSIEKQLFGQPGSLSKFPQFLWVKLWVGWVGRGYIEISRYFPALWINQVTLVTKKTIFGIHWDIKSPLNHQNGFMVCSFASRSLIQFFQYTIPPQQPCKVFSHWLIIYPREYKLQHSPNLVDVGL